ncbi:MAG: FAD:protein FMN transferase [Synergistaceae bacterium]|jgi:thiamine biosynthesis lipoprotein|nr:FAD:protein FMN transferase [Synergistaceae bacterium]
MSRRTYRVLAALLFAALVPLALWAWNRDGGSRGKPRKFSAEFFDTFNTLVSFTAFVKDDAEFERYSNILHEEMSRLHRLFDIYNSYDGLVNMKTLNDAAGTAPMRVDPSIAELLEIARNAYDDTGGAVNAALGPVLSIWHDHRERALANGEDASVPSRSELIAAGSHISVHDIVIDRERSTVFLRYDDMRLDVGALAKGYAVQKTVELLRKSGLQSGLINAGGNVAVIGEPLDGRETWSIGVRAPSDGDVSKILDVLYLSNGSVVTSGNDQRYFTAEGRRYHHIIDPKTLFPADGVRAVTVFHPDSATADILSTAAFILPRDEARSLIARHGAEAIWLMSDGTKLATPGYLRLSQLGGSAAEKEGSGKP